MEKKNILNINNRKDFRKWLEENHNKEKECWLILKRGKPVSNDFFYYIDAIEEALCFGWIDSTLGLIDGIRMQRLSPRSKNSNWTELNKERVRRLEKLGLMTDAGRKVLPDMNIDNFRIDKDIKEVITQENLWENFSSFPPLYQRIRTSNLAFHKKRSIKEYSKMLNIFIEKTRQGKMYGEWNDYGRLE